MKREILIQGHGPKENAMHVMMKAEIGVMLLQAKDYQLWPESEPKNLLQSSKIEPTLPTPQFWPYSLWNYNKFLLFKPSSLWFFLCQSWQISIDGSIGHFPQRLLLLVPCLVKSHSEALVNSSILPDIPYIVKILLAKVINPNSMFTP